MPKVLIVDDSLSDAALAAGLLRKRGHDCECIHDGTQALDRVKRSRPDVVLLDVVMYGQTGFDICRRLKEDPGTGDVPVVFMTARANDGDKLWARRIGAAAYVCKPFTPDELYAAVEQGLQSRCRPEGEEGSG